MMSAVLNVAGSAGEAGRNTKASITVEIAMTQAMRDSAAAAVAICFGREDEISTTIEIEISRDTEAAIAARFIFIEQAAVWKAGATEALCFVGLSDGG